MTWDVITMRCAAGHVWQRRTKNKESRDPPCPLLDCPSRLGVSLATRADAPALETPSGPPIGIDFNNPRAPAIVGANLSVKAIDQTASIVMQDYGMTDQRSDVRMGETSAPKLPPLLQQQADSFFVGRGGRQRMGVRDPSTGHTVNLRSNPAAIGMAAIKGGYRQGSAGAVEPIAALHGMTPELRDSIRPKTKIEATFDPRRARG